jgi:hypothetical protein
MGQTLNGNVDTSATNGFTPGSCDQLALVGLQIWSAHGQLSGPSGLR